MKKAQPKPEKLSKEELKEMYFGKNPPTPRQDEPSEWNEENWLLNFAFVMESLGAKKPTQELEKWEQLMVLIEAKSRNRAISEREKVLREVEERIKDRKINDLPADNGGKCDFILDHNPVWDGNYYTCSQCGIEFIPAKWLNLAFQEIRNFLHSLKK